MAFNLGGLLVVAAGIATYPVPVIPSEIVILLGLALVSQGSLGGARRRWPKWLRRSVGVAWMVGISALSYWVYRSLCD